MADLLIRHVDGVLAERIRSLAKERRWSTNEVLLYALRNGLGLSAAHEYSEFARDDDALKNMGADWEEFERRVFNEAMLALARASPTQFAPETVRTEPSARAAE